MRTSHPKIMALSQSTLAAPDVWSIIHRIADLPEVAHIYVGRTGTTRRRRSIPATLHDAGYGQGRGHYFLLRVHALSVSLFIEPERGQSIAMMDAICNLPEYRAAAKKEEEESA